MLQYLVFGRYHAGRAIPPTTRSPRCCVRATTNAPLGCRKQIRLERRNRKSLAEKSRHSNASAVSIPSLSGTVFEN